MKTFSISDNKIKPHIVAPYELPYEGKSDFPVAFSENVLENPAYVAVEEIDLGLFFPHVVPFKVLTRASVQASGVGVTMVGEKPESEDLLDCLALFGLSGNHRHAYVLMAAYSGFQVVVEADFAVKQLLASRMGAQRQLSKGVDALAVMAPGDRVDVKITVTPGYWWQRLIFRLLRVELQETYSVEYFGGEPVFSNVRLTPKLKRLVDYYENYVSTRARKMARDLAAVADEMSTVSSVSAQSEVSSAQTGPTKN